MVAIRENLNPVEEGCRETLSPPALRSHRYFDRAVVVVAGGGRRVEDELYSLPTDVCNDRTAFAFSINFMGACVSVGTSLFVQFLSGFDLG